MDSVKRREIISSSPISFSSLRRINIAAGIFHLIQGLIMLSLGLLIEWEREIYTFYLDINITSIVPPIFEVVPNPQVVFTLGYLGVILASFSLMSAAAHFLIAFPLNSRYTDYLKTGMNPYRWYEYAFSSSVMIVLISLLTGVWDLWSLVMFFVLNAMMIMFGYLMELLNQYTARVNWSPYLLGCISGGTPWLVLFAYFFSAISSTGLEPPTFVYMIIFIYFFLFNVFAINMVLQYKGISRWKDYLYGERFYILLSFIAKSVLAWIVFVGIFAPF